MADSSARELLLAELRIALLHAKSAQAEIEFLGSALKKGILTEHEVVEALEEVIGWSGFLRPLLMVKIREALGGDVVKT